MDEYILIDNDDDKCNKKCQILESFVEHEEVLKLINKIPTMSVAESERSLERFIIVINLYQAQPHLLDAYLETMLGALLTIIKNKNITTDAYHLSFKFLYTITKTRGYKVIVRMMPHDVGEMKPVLDFLTKEDPANPETWQTRYMLLLWLSIVCMVPFDLDKFDDLHSANQQQLSTMDRIINLGQVYLAVSDKSQDAATFLLSKVFTRPDVRRLRLDKFVDWCNVVLVTFDKNDKLSVTLLLGILRFVVFLFKFSRREDVLQNGKDILSTLMKMDLQSTSSVSTIRKLFIKSIRRIGLQFLKLNVPKWRYNRGLRNLEQNLSAQKLESGEGNENRKGSKEGVEDGEEEDYNIPEEIEEIIEKLLLGLQDKDSQVRWSAAKGVGQITGRLPKSLADEVVESVLSLFTPNQSEATWHGGCLCLGDLGCRGLLLPYRLKQVVPIIMKALVFEERRGNFSVGSIVRDSACYVCWSFARAYDCKDIQEYVEDIARALVVVSLFDRDVTVRRAAAAAFQENVGRQGSFPHGIDIITTCDYFAVGNRTHCYLELSNFVGMYDEYKYALIDHILEYKLSHWDSALRELAAESLHVLSGRNIEYITNKVLSLVLERSLSRDIASRHGHIVASGQLVHGVFKYYDGRLDAGLDENVIEAIVALPEKLISLKYFKGVHADMTRRSVCIYIEKVSLSNLNIKSETTLKIWRSLIDESLQSLDLTVQATAVTSMAQFSKRYFYIRRDEIGDNELCQLSAVELVDNYCQLLTSPDTSTQSLCGYCCTLSSLSPNIISQYSGTIMRSLMNVVAPKFCVEVRRDAVKAIGNISTSIESDSTDAFFTRENMYPIYSMLFRCMPDYTVDGRGDVGSWIREASLDALYKLTIWLVTHKADILTADIIEELFEILVQQGMEKITRIRTKSIGYFIGLLHNSPPIPHIPSRMELEAVFDTHTSAEDLNWSRMMPLLSIQSYSYPAMVGLVVSVGGLSESLIKQSSEALMNFLSGCDVASDVRRIFYENLLKIHRNFSKNDRIIFPLFNTFDQLLNHGAFIFNSDVKKDEFFSELFKLMKNETEKSKDVQKILIAINVFCGLLDVVGVALRTSILQRLSILLCHPFPKVRSHCATMLYSATLASDWMQEAVVDEFTNIVTETKWEEPVEELKSRRNQICSLLQLPVPVPKKF